RHRAGHADLALTTDFGAGDGRVFLVQNADGAGGEQEFDDPVFVRARAEPVVIMQYGGDDARGAIGGRGDHPSAGGIFFVDGQGIQVDPVEDGQRIGERVFRFVA